MRLLVTLLTAMLSCSGGILAQQPKEITNSIGMKFVLIPPGKYRPAVSMDAGDQGMEVQEGTVKGLSAERKEVSIGENLYLGATEVTREQYGRFADDIHLKYYPDSMKWWPRPTPDGRDRYRFKPEEKDLPVNAVGWPHADLFCRLLSELPEEKAAGRSYRLPTAAEWEYACLAGSSSRFSFGDSEETLEEYAWYNLKPGEALLHPVGKKKPNAWGLHDMYGNVSEWCDDLIKNEAIPFRMSAYEYTALYEAALRRAVQPGGVDIAPRRAIRGGATGDSAAQQATMSQDALQNGMVTQTPRIFKRVHEWYIPTSSTLGFRIALISTGKPTPSPSSPVGKNKRPPGQLKLPKKEKPALEQDKP